MTILPAAVPDEAMIRDVLRQVIDPEIGMDIVALGLVYRVDVSADCVRVDITLTSPACPLGELILDDADKALRQALPATVRPELHLVWEPPWDPSMLTDDAKRHFGWTPA
jgi:metal-sulfur cluster biosynthetic enzyme